MPRNFTSRGGAAKAEGPSKEAINFVMKELAAKGGFNSDFNGRTLISEAAEQLGADPRLLDRGENKTPFVPVAYGDATYPQLLRQLTTGKDGKAPPFGSAAEVEAAIAKAHGADAITDEIRAEALSDAKAHGKFMSGAYMGSGKAAHAALQTAGEMLVSDEVPEQLLGIMNLTTDKLRAKYGNAPADAFEAEVKAKIAGGDIAGAVKQVGLTDEQLKEVIKPEGDNYWSASQPELKDIPVLGGIPRWGYAAAAAGGLGAGSVALAQHLAAQGQQQQSPADYAVAMQALNAY